MHTNALRAEIHRFGKNLCGENPVLDDLLIVIKVIDKHVQRLNPLLQTGFGLLPFSQRDDPRDDIEGPSAVDHVAFGVDGKSDAHQLDGHFSCRFMFAQLAGVQVREVFA